MIIIQLVFQVTKSFFYLLLVYVFFILSFALGFYVLFNKEYNVNGEKQEMKTKKNDYQYFNTTWQTFVKASTMFTGEQVTILYPSSTTKRREANTNHGIKQLNCKLIFRSLETFHSITRATIHSLHISSSYRSFSSLWWFS